MDVHSVITFKISFECLLCSLDLMLTENVLYTLVPHFFHIFKRMKSAKNLFLFFLYSNHLQLLNFFTLHADIIELHQPMAMGFLNL